MRDAIPFAVVFAIFFLPLIAALLLGATFGQRCSAAGYEGAQHERCVDRISKGGFVYVENQSITKRARLP